MGTRSAVIHGPALRALREVRGLSQEELAKRAGMSQGAYSRLESGQRPYSGPANIRALAVQLGVEVGAFTYVCTCSQQIAAA